MKTIITLLTLCTCISLAAQPALYADVTAGVTSRVQGRVNADAGVIVNQFTAEANFMLGEMDGLNARYGASVGYQIGERPFGLRIYAGGSYGNFYKAVHLPNGYEDDKVIQAVKPMAGVKLLFGSGAVDLRYTTHDISITVGFQMDQLVKFIGGN